MTTHFRFVFGVLLVLASVCGRVLAHHSYAAHYFEDKRMTIKGEIASFDYRSPHARVLVDVPNRRNRIKRFTVEWSNPRTLHGQGITRYVLKPGDQVLVVGSPSRVPGQDALHMKRIERSSDGWKWVARTDVVDTTE